MFRNVKLFPDKDPVETFGSCELSLFAANDAETYETCIAPVIERLAKELVLGTYSAEAAQIAFFSTITKAGLKYEYENGDRAAAESYVIASFDYNDRKNAALLLLYAFMDQIKKRAEELASARERR